MVAETNKFAKTKSIRFKLHDKTMLFSDEISNLNIELSADKLKNLSKYLTVFNERLAEYIYKENKDSESDKTLTKPNFYLKIKDKFLRTYTKAEYINANKRRNNYYVLSEVTFLIRILETVSKRFIDLSRKFANLLNKNEHQQAKRAEFAILIKELSNKNNFIFLKEFISYSQDTRQEELNQQLLFIVDELSPLLEQAKQYYLPAQTNGVVIARASLNYYTIDKKPKDYNQEIQAEKNSLNYKFDNNHNILCQYTFNGASSNEYRVFIKDLLPAQVTIAEVYSTIKKFKAEAKAQFYEDVTKKAVTFADLKAMHPLFACNEKSFNAFVEKTAEIIMLNGEINQLDNYNDSDLINQKQGKIKELKIQRGKDFIMSPINKGAEKYIALSNLYKAVAMKYGKQKTKIKSLEQEKLQSQFLNYWCLVEQQTRTKHNLILIPKENRLQAKIILETFKNIQINKNQPIIYWFKSLTFRALKKLCFSGNENSFTPCLQKEIKDFKKIEGLYSLEDKSESDLVKFYQSVIHTNYFLSVVDTVDFSGFDKLSNNNYNSLAEFEIDLEKICYTKIAINSDNIEQAIIEKCGGKKILITSYDLNKDAQRKTYDKAHTSLWNKFWSENNKNAGYPVRLNPEITISYRAAKQSRLKKYGKNTENYNEQKFKHLDSYNKCNPSYGDFYFNI